MQVSGRTHAAPSILSSLQHQHINSDGWMSAARFYVSLDTKYVISENILPSQSLGSVLIKPNRTKLTNKLTTQNESDLNIQK